MRILYYKRTSIMRGGVEQAFDRLGFHADPVACERAGSEWDESEALDKALREKCDRNAYDAAFSLNFNPQVSEICEQKGLLYIAWINDSPLYIRDEHAIKRNCNRLFTFDRGYVAEYRQRNMPFFHMPLAADTELFDHSIRNASSKATNRYRSEVAMVGNLYSTNYKQLIRPLSAEVVSLLEQMLQLQQKIEGRSIFPEVLTSDFLQRINQEYAQAGIDFTVDGPGLEYLMLSETTGRERKLIPSLLAKHCDVRVYSKDPLPLPGVHMESPVDYQTQMPLVFRHSKININTTLRTIRTGIPLRALDIMGCGGFLLTNAQEEILEYFTPGKELVVYHGIEDLYEKVRWYLSHESERVAVAAAGLARVRQDFTFDGQIKKMFVEALSA